MYKEYTECKNIDIKINYTDCLLNKQNKKVYYTELNTSHFFLEMACVYLVKGKFYMRIIKKRK